MLGGASGALIVEGIERADRAVAGLPERVLVIRDQELLNPDAPPAKSEPVVPKNLVDNDGDAVNSGTGFGKPSKDLSINFVPVPYPDYPPATLTMKPRARELWRVLNASAITYLNLAVLVQARRRNRSASSPSMACRLSFNGSPAPEVQWINHIGVPPGARVGVHRRRSAARRAGAAGDARGRHRSRRRERSKSGAGIASSPRRCARAARATCRQCRTAAAAALPWLGNVAPVRVRKLYFSEKLDNPNDPEQRHRLLYLTVDGATPTAVRSAIRACRISSSSKATSRIGSSRTARWSCTTSTFISSTFSCSTGLAYAVNEPFLRDTVNVPYYNGRMLRYPSVRLRMDFRDPNIVGTVRLPLPRARARGRRDDGTDPRRAGRQRKSY